MDARTILTDDELETLRGGYDPAVMRQVVTTLTMANFTESKGWFDWLADSIYALPDDSGKTPLQMDACERERCLVAVFAAGRRPPFALAAHVYWGLMEGLSVNDMAETILLAATYGGADVFADGMFTLSETLKVMKHLAGGTARDATAPVVLPSLVDGFRSRPSAALCQEHEPLRRSR